ncbi:sugar porter family MFS transporter [Sphingobacterium shayense]|uniref:sugar porter family MFS transporter n=1 Tax=Sphingobacterium shayense TaxID=626343 RepID=UPI00155318C7|nr:sugar porter family MFS transporter [Sphingobacterium shayense]NQD70115.1 sugar porter family MFS transporter [Sphingobacterium shayense]
MEKTNRFLALICAVASIGGFLFGFDMAVISGVLPLMQAQFSLSPGQEGWLVSSALVGCIIGVAISGALSDKLGRRKLLFAAAILFWGSALGCGLLDTFSSIIGARIVAGLGVGIASNIVPLYISEMAPAERRGRYVTYYQLAITIGILAAYISNYGLLSHDGSGALGWGETWALLFVEQKWRAMFLVGLLPATLFILGLFFVPESSRWVAQQKEAAEQNDQSASKHVSQTTAKGSYNMLFSKAMRRPLLLGILLPLFSQFCGINAIIYYGPTILKDAGISMDNSYQSQILFGAANMLFTFIAIWKVDQLGRRPLYLIGSFCASLSLILTGVFFYLDNVPGLWILLTVTLFLASFAFSIGPLKFVVASEIFPTAIRGRALGISIMVMWVADAIIGQLTAVMIRDLGIAYTFWLFGLFCVVVFISVFKLLPETKGKTLEEIENFWKKTKN